MLERHCDSLADRYPQLTTDSAGNWIAVWTTWDYDGDDDDIRFSRSTDNGHTWTDAAPLRTEATDSPADYPQITTDSLGTWIAVWQSQDSLGGTIGTDRDILFSRSTDVGQTWSDPAPLNTNASTDAMIDEYPQLTTDSAGNWIAVWQSADIIDGSVTDRDIFFSHSTDNGQTWTDPAPLNSNAANDSGNDRYPQLTTNSAGNWIAVWESDDNLSDTIGADWDILFSRSTDNGQTWTPAAALNITAATDSAMDWHPQLTTDSLGNWVAMWQFRRRSGRRHD